MEIRRFDVMSNDRVAKNTYCLTLLGDCSAITSPGQFVNIELPGFFLRRPLSVCRVCGEVLTLVYKVVGEGTKKLAETHSGSLELMTGLGNGFDVDASGEAPLLVGGGAGVAPMYWLAECLIAQGKKPRVALGFNTEEEVCLAGELSKLGAAVMVATLDGTAGVRGFVTDAIEAAKPQYDYIYACGPEPMLRAVYNMSGTDGEYSFEKRMACGFGACMGCSCETKYGSKRICRDGPVLKRGEIIW